MFKELYKENYKTLLKEIKGKLNREIIHIHEQEDSTVLRCRFFLI